MIPDDVPENPPPNLNDPRPPKVERAVLAPAAEKARPEPPKVRTSPDITELCAAFALAQGEMEMAAKDTENPHFRRTYADLASVWKACRPALARHGLGVCQIITGGFLVTRLVHKSGQWIEGEVGIAGDESTGRTRVQAFGSALTYLRRYALSAMVGIAPDDDDDGNAATPARPQNGRRA